MHAARDDVPFETANTSRLLCQAQSTLALAQLAGDTRALDGLPAPTGDVLNQLHFFLSPHTWRDLMDSHGRAKATRPLQRNADDGTDERLPVGLAHLPGSRVRFRVRDDISLTCAHQAQTLLAELLERVAPHD